MLFGAAGATGLVSFLAGRQTAPVSPESSLSAGIRESLKLQKDQEIPKDALKQFAFIAAKKTDQGYEKILRNSINIQGATPKDKLFLESKEWKNALTKELDEYKQVKLVIKVFAGVKNFAPIHLQNLLQSKVTDEKRKVKSSVIKVFEPNEVYRVVAEKYKVGQGKELNIVKYIKDQLKKNYNKK